MNSSIGKKILGVIFVPFSVVFGALLVFISLSVLQYVRNWTELELKGISEINAANLEGRIYSVRTSLLSAINMLDMLDTGAEGSRKQAENIIRAMSENHNVYSAWLACEPDSFDGRDLEHTGDYAGAPSGRFICSFIRSGGELVAAPDMDETTLDDPGESPWYVTPRDSNSLYINIDNPKLCDYGMGDGPVYSMTISAPIHKNGRVIGCVGVDLVFDVTTIGIDRHRQAAVAVFCPNGRIFYSQDISYSEESIDTLGFTQTTKIKDAMSNTAVLFLENEYSAFLGTQTFTYLQPIKNQDSENCLYLYTAIPRTSVYAGVTPIFRVMSGVASAVVILLFVMFIYVSRRISRPLRLLTLAANEISKGDLETEITSFKGKKDEIDVLSRSLHRMVEQFRVYIISLEQTQEKMTVFDRLDEFIKSGGDADALRGLASMLCRHYASRKVTVVRVDGGRAVAFSCDPGEKPGGDFLYHPQICAAIDGKSLAYINTYTMSALNLSFFDESTLSVCIVPIRTDAALRGYIILENGAESRPFNFSSEIILTGVADALADWEKGTPQ